MKNTLIAVLVIAVVGLGAYVLLKKSPQSEVPTLGQGAPIGTTTPSGGEVATTTEQDKGETAIGTSVEGRAITAYHYGTGSQEILFIGDIHGGYTWNTALLAYKTMDYFKSNPDVIPSNLKVTVIPVLNPDGLNRVVGTSTASFTQADVEQGQAAQIAGRFNANTVDLNRNFDCDWKSSAIWQGRTVSGGSGAFSEPESQAIKTYVETNTPKAVVAWYASAGGVFASSCDNGVLPETLTLTDIYATAAGYKAYDSYDFNAIPGDMVNWLAKMGIPAISVLLTTHTDTEWTKNQAGIKAILDHYAE
ncbi:MAG: M14 family metallopeptidase [Candidatus Parcubacteria bacterium]|nr:M14 family metallopeptidase [Candidatus Parcubacteria bacterium]